MEIFIEIIGNHCKSLEIFRNLKKSWPFFGFLDTFWPRLQVAFLELESNYRQWMWAPYSRRNQCSLSIRYWNRKKLFSSSPKAVYVKGFTWLIHCCLVQKRKLVLYNNRWFRQTFNQRSPISYNKFFGTLNFA